MRSPTEKGVNGPLLLLLGVLALGQIIEGYWLAQHQYPPPLWHVLNALMGSYIPFVWFCRDSDAHHYRRSKLRNIGFLFCSFVFVPYYLVRSRAAGQKWRALLRLAGYCFLMLAATATGMAVIALITAFA